MIFGGAINNNSLNMMGIRWWYMHGVGQEGHEGTGVCWDSYLIEHANLKVKNGLIQPQNMI